MVKRSVSSCLATTSTSLGVMSDESERSARIPSRLGPSCSTLWCPGSMDGISRRQTAATRERKVHLRPCECLYQFGRGVTWRGPGRDPHRGRVRDAPCELPGTSSPSLGRWARSHPPVSATGFVAEPERQVRRLLAAVWRRGIGKRTPNGPSPSTQSSLCSGGLRQPSGRRSTSFTEARPRLHSPVAIGACLSAGGESQRCRRRRLRTRCPNEARRSSGQ